MDVAELSLPANEQLDQLRITQMLIERITTISRSLLGSNRFVDVVTYRISASQDPDYVAELIEHTGPQDARAVFHARGGSRNIALFLLLDIAERQLQNTMTAQSGPHINTRRLGGHRCSGCNGSCGGPTA